MVICQVEAQINLGKNIRNAWLFQRVMLQHIERDDVNRADMCSLQINLRGGPFLMRLQKAARAQAPTVARFQPDKAIFRAGGGQVIAKIFRQGQKFCRHHSADCVPPLVHRAGIAAAIAEKPCQRRCGTAFQHATKHVERGVLYHAFAFRRKIARSSEPSAPNP